MGHDHCCCLGDATAPQALESTQASQALQLKASEEEKEREVEKEKVRERAEEKEKASQQLRRSVGPLLVGVSATVLPLSP